MSAELKRQDGSPFASGASRYLDRDPGTIDVAGARVHVRVAIEGIQVMALLDTGAAWSVVRPELAQELGLLDRDGAEMTLSSRLGTHSGRLVRVNTELLADHGESIELESTMFVSAEWPGGNFLGYGGLLERVRFAIDPELNQFWFGAIA
jgi:hypothetical protein